MLSREALNEFKQIWLLEYGRPIDDQKAESIAVKLLAIMRPIYQPIPKNKKSDLLSKPKKYDKSNK